MNRTDKKFSWGVLLAALIMAAGVLLLTVWLLSKVASNSPNISQTPLITVIFAETATPLGNEELFSTATPTPTGIRINGIGVGDYVQITGTEGVGLRIRQAPGMEGAALFLGMESEVFKIKDGPEEKDGIVWWFIEAPYDEGRSGWAAAQFLAVVTSQGENQP